MANDEVKIISWRFAGVIIPWITIFTMFLIAHEKYIKMQQIVESFPRFVETVSVLKEDVGIMRVEVRILSERVRDMSTAIDRMTRGRRPE